ncbi:MAG: MarR family transcriptional regulator [Oscillospiraceae bacterium]|nr:MarR family transcriptional regulator [Oscillospiraceae bacterium]
MEHTKLKRLNCAISSIHSIYHHAACQFGMSDSVMMILYTVSVMEGKCLLRDIYTLSGMPKQTINSAIRKLEQKEIIYLENQNKKAKNVCLTPKGKMLAEKTVVKLISAENHILESWTETDADLYIRLNQKYVEDLSQQLLLLTEKENLKSC